MKRKYRRLGVLQRNRAAFRNPVVFHALRVAEQYKMVDERVERLLEVVSEMAKKWLNSDYEKKVKIEIRLADFDEKDPKALDK